MSMASEVESTILRIVDFIYEDGCQGFLLASQIFDSFDFPDGSRIRDNWNHELGFVVAIPEKVFDLKNLRVDHFLRYDAHDGVWVDSLDFPYWFHQPEDLLPLGSYPADKVDRVRFDEDYFKEVFNVPDDFEIYTEVTEDEQRKFDLALKTLEIHLPQFLKVADDVDARDYMQAVKEVRSER